MAREAGFMLVTDPDPDTGGWWECFDSEIETLVTLVRADERKIVMNEPLTKEMWQRFEDEIRADEREASLDAVLRVIKELYPALVLAAFSNRDKAWALDKIKENIEKLKETK
jgi:hypothetical protein